jgi:PTH1 family peptidyl-tRNA hydrolase
MRVVVGLGNPGERYASTRHNAGFLAVDVLAARTCAPGRAEGELWVAAARLAGLDVLLAKPLAYMNRSGPPLARLLTAAGLNAGDLVVVVDDVALELGRIRVRERGSAGGHNGLRSLSDALGTEEFVRVRVGVRRGDLPPELADYVLSGFEGEDEKTFGEAVVRAADAVECIVAEGVVAAMNRFNRPQP